MKKIHPTYLLASFFGIVLMLLVAAQQPSDYDWKSGRTNSQYIILPNEATTGTSLYQMASPVSVGGELRVVKTATGQMNAFGVCVHNCGTAGNAVILVIGQSKCDFDGAATTNNFVQNSATNAGKCTDVGSVRPVRGKIVGRVGQTIGSAGVASVVLFGIGVQGSLQAIKASATLDFSEIGSGQNCDDLTIPVAGAIEGDPVALGRPSGTPARSTFEAFVSAADVVTVRHCAHGGSPNPASGTFNVAVLK